MGQRDGGSEGERERAEMSLNVVWGVGMDWAEGKAERARVTPPTPPNPLSRRKFLTRCTPAVRRGRDGRS